MQNNHCLIVFNAAAVFTVFSRRAVTRRRLGHRHPRRAQDALADLVATMELADDRVGRMLVALDVVDGLVKLRIEWPTHRFPRGHAIGPQEIEQRTQHHLDPFDDRLAVTAAARGVDRALEVVG